MLGPASTTERTAPAAALGPTIRARRLALGLTQEQLAERVSTPADYVRQGEISRIESGRVKFPAPARLARIALALGMQPGDLLAASGWYGAAIQAAASVDPAGDDSAGPTGSTSVTTSPALPSGAVEALDRTTQRLHALVSLAAATEDRLATARFVRDLARARLGHPRDPTVAER